MINYIIGLLVCLFIPVRFLFTKEDRGLLIRILKFEGIGIISYFLSAFMYCIIIFIFYFLWKTFSI